MKIEITSIIIMATNGQDEVELKTKLPCQYGKEFVPSQPELSLTFKCPSSTAIKYVSDNFPNIPYRTINVRSN